MSQFAVDNPFLETLGVSVAQWRDGYAELVMPIEASKLNRQGVLQGGAIATLLDAAAGYAGLFSPAGEPPRHGFTLSLTTNYLDKGLGQFVRAKGFLERGGRSIFFARAEAWVDDRLLIASAQGTFKYSKTA
ncbi:MAG TPA: PaaI family thioesterase [Paraburkholderia sp.]|uniref:PaaI family thioesterase n=1 Tax=Paraburkholderia sp. TaxID=1926495 RepID=UPI002B787CF8|nr:PaaI family thioesterase [Paraburkholderia sp.]HTR08630.1 PaaI family thioesterase [Paraburkholderia sp.]